ncbi:MAG: RraA family protein [Rhodospirillum sp.]|nr:RraA family protein [Rhodospirillum sp.]MCF8491308.1 RraA family protein [Rhodospirillum sp.]MCF8502174.1 RraA family protein [Rhodospirillum sp.]
MTVGFRILNRKRCIDAALVADFAALPVANVSDSMNRMVAAGPNLRPMHTSGILAGAAVTVRCRPGDNLMLHKAIDMAVPGDVIVVDAGGDLTNSLMGELMLAHAINRGVAGFVLYGAIRDLDAFREVNVPIFAAGVSHRGPYKDGPGEINVPISLEGMVVEPGDLILGDSDGVVAVPLDMADEILAATRAKHAAETRQMETIKARTNDRSWVDVTLKQKGCLFPDD